jgi:ribosome maturation factor RimP
LGPLFLLECMIGLNRDAIGEVIERAGGRSGVELVHWEAVGPPSNFVLRIYIDKPGGVSHSDCEAVSKQVGVLLDVEDLIPTRYTLEVSSPGIERGLYKPADFERFVGQRVKIRTAQPLNGQRNFRGALKGCEQGKVSLVADGLGLIEIPYDKIVKANIEYQF